VKSRYLRPLGTLGLIVIFACLAGCAVTRSGTSSSNSVLIATGAFSIIQAGAPAVRLTANQAVYWALTFASQPCSPACGTLSASQGPGSTATYTPPTTPPTYGSATIIATSAKDITQDFVLAFRIAGALQVSITTTKFQSVVAGSAPIPIAASITNDLANQGLTWTLTAGGSDCSAACGTLIASAAPGLTATYTPPNSAPSGAADSPTITASSVTNPQVKDTISFSIQPAILVVITSTKFKSVIIGSPSIHISATISNDSANAGLAWSLAAAGSNCSPACGTLVASASPGLTADYTPPSTAPTGAAASPTITVSSITNPLASDTISFAIGLPIQVTITPPKFTNAYAGSFPISLSATITNDNANAGLTWSLTASGSPCSPACGTLAASNPPNLNMVYTPPPTVPSGAADTPTITVSSVTDPSASDSFSFSILSSNVLLKGSYTFLMRGYDTNGFPLAMAGSVTADGNGNITAGELDINDDGGTDSVPGPLAGTYTVDLSFQNVTRGTITITNFNFPGTTTGIAFRFTLSADGTRGKIIEMDGAGYREAGALLLQDPAALSAANPSGSYAFGLDADVPGSGSGRTVEVGRFVLGATGDVSGGLIDLSRAAALLPIYSGQSLDPESGTAPDASGRGLLTLSVQGNRAQYAYYLVNSQQLNLIEIDHGWAQATIQAGTARRQQSLTADSVNGTSVLQMTGIDTSTVNALAPNVVIGVMNISGGTSFGITLDFNDLGNVGQGQHISGGAASYDPTTGRGTITVDHGFNHNFVNQAVFYMYAPGAGFLIDADPSPVSVPNPPLDSVTNQGFSGTFVPQQVAPFTVAGNMLFFSGSSSTPDIPEVEGATHFSSSDGTTSFAVELTSVSSGNFPGLSLAGSYSTTLDPIIGHGSAQVPQAFFGEIANGSQLQPASLYAIGANQFVLIGMQSGQPSGVSFFDAQ
jgi:hypothetical protein